MKEEELNYKNIILVGVMVGILMCAVTLVSYKWENRNVPEDTFYLQCFNGSIVGINVSHETAYGCSLYEVFHYGVYEDVRDLTDNSQYDIQGDIFNYSYN